MADIKVIVAVVAALIVGAVVGGLIGHFAVPMNDPVSRPRRCEVSFYSEFNSESGPLFIHFALKKIFWCLDS